MLVEKIKKLLDQKNIHAKDMLSELGINKNQLSIWKKAEKDGCSPRDPRKFKTVYVKAIADYLDVSTAYLYGDEDIPFDQSNQNIFISYKSEERPKIDLRGSERLWEDSGNSVEELDSSFDPTQEKSNPNTTELDEYEKKLIGTFRETTIDGKMRILNAADEIKKDIEKKHNGKNSSFA